MFQSTYLYKVRLLPAFFLLILAWFQSTYLYKVRRSTRMLLWELISFNPRTYIRYDCHKEVLRLIGEFQSTYLYKVRLTGQVTDPAMLAFQSTYLYKVRPIRMSFAIPLSGFNPRTYIRYDTKTGGL